MIAAVTIAALLLPVVQLGNSAGVDPDPYHGDIITWDEQVNAPEKQPAPEWATTPTEDAPVYDPEPLVCRPEAPFPQDECVTPTTSPTTEPEITPGDIEHEVKRIGLPRLTTMIQPPGTTLVNLDTIFHTTAEPFDRTVQILDSTVHLKAQPTTYTWHHGDGTTQTTRTPGNPYPATDITHHYRQPGHLTASVDVTYTVTYQIDDNTWQQLDTTITAPGPATPLRIREARPVLTR